MTSVLLLSLSLCALVFTFSYTAAPYRVSADTVDTELDVSICGDFIVNPGEVCDQGSTTTGAYGSSTAERECLPDCSGYGPYCGDSILQPFYTEECDDGNNTNDDLCSAQCQEESIPDPGGGGDGPAVGSTPFVPGAIPGLINSANETKVVLRGKAYPNSMVHIILDGQEFGEVQADSNAEFLFTTTEITPGTATFGFWATDLNQVESITTSMVFEVVQSAVTTLANIFIPPTIEVAERQVDVGALVTLSGSAAPGGAVTTEIHTDETQEASFESDVDVAGVWALQLDTASLPEGFLTAKSLVSISEEDTASGYGKSVSFFVGDDISLEDISTDLNADTNVNLVDFSIFLIHWGTDDIRTDFNQDGTVNLADFSIMLFDWTG